VIQVVREAEPNTGTPLSESANTDKETENKKKRDEIDPKVLDGEMIKDVIEDTVNEEQIMMEEEELVFKIPVVKRKAKKRTFLNITKGKRNGDRRFFSGS